MSFNLKSQNVNNSNKRSEKSKKNFILYKPKAQVKENKRKLLPWLLQVHLKK